MHNQVNRRLAVLFARILGLPDDYVWDKVNTKGGILGETSYFRYQIYHAFDPKDYEDAELIMHGHTDYGVATLLASQPITCLQMLDRHDKWRYIKYEPHRYLVNLGDALEVVSGGQFKATRHKVVKPPRDQMQYTRIALISFCHAWRNLRLEPLNGAYPLHDTADRRIALDPRKRPQQGIRGVWGFLPTFGERPRGTDFWRVEVGSDHQRASTAGKDRAY